jgi:trans-aconitate methyltransferase
VSQTWDAEAYARTASFVPKLGEPLVDVLDPRPGEHVLDVGCGDGALTALIAARGARVVGIDASPAMVAAAQARGLDARVMDAARLALPERFDAVFSNAALHWVPDLDAAVAGIAAHLRPGGRVVAEMGGHGNVAAIRTALHAALAARGLDARAHDPWHYPTVAAFRRLLDRHGLTPLDVVLVPRPTPLDAGMAAWITTFGGAFLAAIPEPERQAFVDEVVARLAPALRDDEGKWTADYVRLRSVAVMKNEE